MANKGRLLLLKVGDGNSPETYLTPCGFKARSFTINNNLVDTSRPDCQSPGGIVRYTGMYGIQTLTFSGSGTSEDSATNLRLKDAARNQTDLNCQIVVPDEGVYEGAVLIGSMEYSGDTEGEMEFSCDITFTGGWTYEAEV